MSRPRKTTALSKLNPTINHGHKTSISKKAITVNQVGLVALVPGIAGGVYGFLSGGMLGMIIGFVEWFAAGFILVYICASFIELFRK